MEEIDEKSLDKEFNLSEKGLKVVAMVAFGYRDKDDFNQFLPKSRVPVSDVVTKI